MDDIKFTALGGSDAWPSDRYLNMWVGGRIFDNLNRELLGYAQFPDQLELSPLTDGVVVQTTAFGRTGNVTSPFHLGRTATHEVGHWLSLFHIWGDAICGDDHVNDTPTQETFSIHCPSHPRISCGSNDMFQNYMDYSDDACMNIFTLGQGNRMLALFSPGGVRESFIENNCIARLCNQRFITSTSTMWCPSGNIIYSLHDIPEGFSINWSTSDNIIIVSGQNSSTLVVKAGPTALVSAVITGDCGSVTVSKRIFIHSNMSPVHLIISGNETVCPNNYYEFEAINTSGVDVQSWNWCIGDSWEPWEIMYQWDNGYSSRVEVLTPNYFPSPSPMYVEAISECASVLSDNFYVDNCYSLIVYPNPADQYIEVSLKKD